MKPRALLAEFIGTFALLWVIFLVVYNFTASPISLFAIAFAVGLTVVCLGTAFGAISGGHFNPCVTFGLLIAKKIDIRTAVAYWVVQILGGIAGVYVASFLLGGNASAARLATSVSRGDGLDLLHAVLAETIAAFLFVLTILMTAVDKRAPSNGALYLGFVLTICIMAIGPISGGAINPAVGVALSLGSSRWENAVSWIAGPMLGALLAGMVYVGMFEREDD